MFRFSFLSCRLFFFTYCHSFFTTSVRGSGFSPTILASAGLGCIAFMKAAFGLRAVFLPALFFAAAFLAAIRCVLPCGGAVSPRKPAHSDRSGSPPSSDFSLWNGGFFPRKRNAASRSTARPPGNRQHRCALPPQEDGQGGLFRRRRREPFALLPGRGQDQSHSGRCEKHGSVLHLPRRR